MAEHSFTRSLLSLLSSKKALSIGTKFNPTSPIENEYVDLFNFTETVLFEIEKAEITTDSIFYNLLRDVGKEYIPENHKFYELKPAEDKIEEYALVSNIIMGNDRFLYVELPYPSRIIDSFSIIIQNDKGEIIEQSKNEIIAKMLSKNDAIRVALKLIAHGLDHDIIVNGAVGMTGAAALERCININKEIGNVSAVAFTKLGGEFALVIDSKFTQSTAPAPEFENYLFIDVIDSTGFINKYSRTELRELMTGVKNFIETECQGQLEGYREGGDDFIARFPSKDLAIRAGLDSAWYMLNNDAKIRAGVGRSRREAGERAQISDNIKMAGNPVSLVVFELANGIYAYNVPSEFFRTLIDLFVNHKVKLISIFIVVFILCYVLAVLGYGIFGFGVIICAIIYALIS